MNYTTTILDIIENGIFITDRDLIVRFWNTWLVNHTNISKETAHGSRLDDLFPNTSLKLLRRKVKIALKLKSSTFANSTVDKYVIPIELKRITTTIFQHMRQNVVITPLSDMEVSIIIYDISPLMEAKAIINEQLFMVKKQATIDHLTQSYNRMMFNNLLCVEMKRVKRQKKTFSLIIFDIDNFKSVNDTYGHLVGDEVIKSMASISTTTIRESDIFARWGGEEFTVLLPETKLENAALVAEKLRTAVSDFDFGEPGHMSCSFGVAEYILEEEMDSIIKDADEALYFAKKNGRDQVSIFDKATGKAREMS